MIESNNCPCFFPGCESSRDADRHALKVGFKQGRLKPVEHFDELFLLFLIQDAQPGWVRYPGNASSGTSETIYLTYNPQGALKSSIGAATYAKEIDYDSSGRPGVINLGLNGANPLFGVDYIYYPWTTQGGRLKEILAGIPSDLSSNPPTPTLESFLYNYDAVGNITSIADRLAGGTQTQMYGYDTLNRLTSASASGGSGGTYSDAYTYDPSTGNLWKKGPSGAQITNTYQDAAHKHAVTHLNGVQKYWYDANGNQTKRILESGTYTLAYDAENRMTGVSGQATASFVYDGDGNRVKETNAYVNLASGIVASGSTAVTNPDVITNGDTWANYGYLASREYGSTSTGLQYVQIDLGTSYPVDKIVVWHYAGDVRTYHNTKTQVSTDGTNWTTVYDSAVSGEYVETAAGKTISFTARDVRYIRDYLNGSTANTGNHWTEIQAWGRATVSYVGNYFEWYAHPTTGVGSPRTMTRYYYAGLQRIAVRHGNGSGTDGLTFLLSDHLGSASKTVDPLSNTYTNKPNVLTENRYKAWGESRHTNGSISTDYTYTGQKSDGYITDGFEGQGVYWMGSRQ